MFTETVHETSVDASTGEVTSSKVTTRETWTPIIYPVLAVAVIAAVLFWVKRRKRAPG